MINLKKIVKDDFKFLSHIPEELVDEKRLKNFLLARESVVSLPSSVPNSNKERPCSK